MLAYEGQSKKIKEPFLITFYISLTDNLLVYNPFYRMTDFYILGNACVPVARQLKLIFRTPRLRHTLTHLNYQNRFLVGVLSFLVTCEVPYMRSVGERKS